MRGMEETNSSHESELSAEPKEGQDEKQVTSQPVLNANTDTQGIEGPALPLAWISGADTTGLEQEEPDAAELEAIEETTEVEKEPELGLADIPDDPVRMYLKEIGRVPLLLSDEEMRLATRMSAANHISKVRDQLQGRQGKTPHERDVLHQIYIELTTTWETVATLYPRLQIQPYDFGDLLAEAQALRIDWQSDEPSSLRAFLERGDWGHDQGWNELAIALFDTYSGLYLLPDETLDALRTHYRHHKRVLRQHRLQSRLPNAEALQENAARIENLAWSAKQTLIRANLRLVVSVAKRYGPRHLVPGPDPGRQHRHVAGRRKVRPHQRVQILHLRHLVDPSGDQPGYCRSGAHHPHSRTHG